MKKVSSVVTAAVAVLALTAPAASATEAAAPAAADAADCTTVFVGEAAGWIPDEALGDPVTVTYTPPATVTVDADRGVTYVRSIVLNIAGDVVAYVDCVV